jgi:hypothetical protein
MHAAKFLGHNMVMFVLVFVHNSHIAQVVVGGLIFRNVCWTRAIRLVVDVDYWI